MERCTKLAVALFAAATLAAGIAAAQQDGPRDKGPRPPAKGDGAKTGKPDRAETARPEAMGISELLNVYEAHKHIGIGTELPYRLLKPAAYHPSRRYPLVVCLHGFPGQGNDNALQLGATYPAGTLAGAEMRRKYPCFVLVPQSTTWWGDQPYGTKDAGASARKDKHFPAMTMLLSCVDELKTSFSIDAERVYLTGHAMGAFGAFNALKQDPNLWGGMVAVSGGSDDPNSAWRFAHVPMWLFGGEKSPILRYSTGIVDALKSAGGRPKLTVIADAPTQCWAQVFDDPAVWDWLFLQRRQLPLLRAASQPATWPATQPGAVRVTPPAAGPG